MGSKKYNFKGLHLLHSCARVNFIISISHFISFFASRFFPRLMFNRIVFTSSTIVMKCPLFQWRKSIFLHYLHLKWNNLPRYQLSFSFIWGLLCFNRHRPFTNIVIRFKFKRENEWERKETDGGMENVKNGGRLEFL